MSNNFSYLVPYKYFLVVIDAITIDTFDFITILVIHELTRN